MTAIARLSAAADARAAYRRSRDQPADLAYRENCVIRPTHNSANATHTLGWRRMLHAGVAEVTHVSDGPQASSASTSTS